MSMSNEELAAIRERAEKANAEMDRLTAGSPGANWRWSIPANPERDTDLILAASTADVPALLAEVERLRGERDEIAAAAGKAAYERDQLQARLDKVRALHTPEECCCGIADCDEPNRGCSGCNEYYPCATIQATHGSDQ